MSEQYKDAPLMVVMSEQYKDAPLMVGDEWTVQRCTHLLYFNNNSKHRLNYIYIGVLENMSFFRIFYSVYILMWNKWCKWYESWFFFTFPIFGLHPDFFAFPWTLPLVYYFIEQLLPLWFHALDYPTALTALAPHLRLSNSSYHSKP